MPSGRGTCLVIDGGDEPFIDQRFPFSAIRALLEMHLGHDLQRV
jgi:hypothetical protein